MRITFVIISIQLCCTALLLASNSRAQNITVDVKNTPVKKILSTIEDQAGVSFVCDNKILEGLPEITLKASNQPLSEVLNQLEKQTPLRFKQSGNLIGVTRINEAKKNNTPPQQTVTNEIPLGNEPPPSRDITGIVTDTAGTPVNGATIKVQNSGISTMTDAEGHFILHNITDNAILIVSFVGYKTQQVDLGKNASNTLNIILRSVPSELQEVAIVSTGYQSLPKVRATGSYDLIDNSLIDRSVTTNILDRINGIASGVLFNNSFAFNSIFTGASSNVRLTGITVRGTSTLNPVNVGTDPLIVMDNFPFDGDLRDINPNDVESITVLKDAAAASIWGARAGNGVIVITTKKGNKNEKPIVEFNSSVTIGNKPNVYYDKNFLNSNDFIKAETYLFNQGFFNSDLTNTFSYPVQSPVVQILAAQKAGTISAADASSQLAALGNNDVRNDFEKYIYQKSLNQQYSLAIRGGGPQIAYRTSVGYDDNRDNLIRNGQQRLTLNSNATYTPIKNLDINVGLNYSQTNVQVNNQEGYGNFVSGGEYGLIPYAQLASSNGTPLAIPYGYRASYIDSLQKLGFQDLHYRPISEIQMANNTTKISDLILKTTATYHFGPHFNAQVLYQNENQRVTSTNDQGQASYYTSNLIDKFAQYNAATKAFTYPFPQGDILNIGNYDLVANNLRGQFNYNQTFNKKSVITALAGAEINQSVTTSYFPVILGYNPQFGTAVTNVDFKDFLNTNPAGSAQITNTNSGESVTTYRFLSYFANAGYTYDNRYTLTLSGREDGANIFGVNTNNRITPLWSAGIGWNVSDESFYHINWLPFLKLRATYGFNGNVYNGSAYTTGTYLQNSLTSLLAINSLTAPNPDLSWEKVKNINLGIDFAVVKNILSGTIELYQKDGLDLLETEPLPTSTGFSSFTGNAASTKTNGIDITLTGRILSGELKWNATLLNSYIHNEVTKYDVPLTNTSIKTGTAVVGKPIYSIFSYKWTGIDQTNGDPEGYLNGQVSKNYTSIINNFKPDSLKFNGSAVPTVFGSFRNDFYFHGFGLSFNIKYELGYYFRRPSTSLNYSDVLLFPNSDFSLAWQKPGDQTNIPSLIYPSNPNRNTFYQYSSILVQNADNIRLQDIRLSYDITKSLWHNMPFKNLQIYSYADNVGILWKANKYGLDPDAIPTTPGQHVLPIPFSISFGLKATY